MTNAVSHFLSAPVNTASVPHRSPFRYPGGKTWLIPIFRRWVQSLSQPAECLIEPFAGGGTIGLAAVFENLVNKSVLTEMDDAVASVWETMLNGDADWLAQRILQFEMNWNSVSLELQRQPEARRDFAFQTILKNRTAHGGILAAGAGFVRHGENGKGLLSRWYPKTLANRIVNIGQLSRRIEFHHGDGFSLLQKYQDHPHAIFFIDPPYTAGGKRAGSRLYQHSEIDHEKLFSQCEKLRGDFLLTYDCADEVKVLASRHGFQTWQVLMQNTHHAAMSELLVGRDLRWVAPPHNITQATQLSLLD